MTKDQLQFTPQYAILNTQYETKYAKQTQFQKRRNEHNSFFNKGLWAMNHELRTKKQTQSKPISLALLEDWTFAKLLHIITANNDIVFFME